MREELALVVAAKKRKRRCFLIVFFPRESANNKKENLLPNPLLSSRLPPFFFYKDQVLAVQEKRHRQNDTLLRGFPPLVSASDAPQKQRRRLVGRARLHLVEEGLVSPAPRAARVLSLLQARGSPGVGAVGPEDLGARARAHGRPGDDGSRPGDSDG